MAKDGEFRPGVVVYPADAIVRCRLVGDGGLGESGTRLGLVLGEHGMQEGEVRGVERTLDALHPIAILPFLGDVAAARRYQPDLELRQLGHGLLRSHIDPDQVGPFAGRIGQQPDSVLVAGVQRRGRQVEALAVDVELPTMEGAANAAFLVAPEVEVGAAMRAMLFDDADTAVAVAEGQQLFAQHLDFLGRAVALG